MKKEFEDLYNDLENINANEMSKTRNDVKEENKKRNIIFIILAIIIDVLIFILLNNSFHGINTFNWFNYINLVIVIDVFLYAYLYFSGKNTSKYKNDFKKYIINELIKNFYDDVNYAPQGIMPRNIYDEGKYSQYYNKYHSDDYFEGKIDNKYEIKMAEVRTEYERTDYDSEGNPTTTTTSVFNGLFSKINMNKSINSELIIRNRVGMFNKNKLEMDSQEFEKYFDVVSDNKIIGMQILTPDIMEILVDFRKKTKINYDIM